MALVGERKAVASAFLALYALIFFLSALTVPQPELVPFLSALAATYGLGFFAVVAGYFWARWFAIGLGLYGFSTGFLLIWQIGPEPVVLFYALTHGAISVLLWGPRVAAHFDGRVDWRERFHLDENATHRLGRAIIRVGLTLPFLLAYGLAPREGAGQMLLAMGAVGVAGVGIWALLRLRTWGVLAMLAGAAAILITAPATAAPLGIAADVAASGVVGAVLLVAAAAPFVGPMLRYVRA
ncbi:MAG TPA: hypothetical protein VNM90_06745 [Haliangium sp.]|nr:hypothetical protein [Haliangium sp.]